MKKLLNVDYIGVQMSYWVIYLLIISYSSAYLLDKDYSNAEIGTILAAANILSIMIQPVVGDFSDRTNKVSLVDIIKIMTLIMAVFIAVIIIINSKSLALSLIYILLVALYMSLQPLLNAIPSRLEKINVHINYGLSRGMGSLAFAVMVVIMGQVIMSLGTGVILFISEGIVGIMLFTLFLIKKHSEKARRINGHTEMYVDVSFEKEKSSMGFVEFIRSNKMYFVLNTGIVLMLFHNVIINNYMLQIIMGVGGNTKDMGLVLGVMAVMEFPAMFFFDRLRKTFSCQLLLKVAAIAFILRIAGCYIAGSVTMVLAAQVFQSISYGIFVPAMVRFVDEMIKHTEAVKGQALFTAMVSVSTVVASLTGGVILDMFNAKMLLLASLVLTVVGSVVVFWAVDKVK